MSVLDIQMYTFTAFRMPSFFVAWIQRGAGNIPQWFWSIFRWWHHTDATDVVNEHPWWEFPITSHRKGDLMDWDLMTVQGTSTENSSCSRNQSEMMWALWHGVLSCFKQLHGRTLVIKRWTWPATIFRYKLAFKQFSVCSKPHQYITTSSSLSCSCQTGGFHGV